MQSLTTLQWVMVVLFHFFETKAGQQLNGEFLKLMIDLQNHIESILSMQILNESRSQ